MPRTHHTIDTIPFEQSGTLSRLFEVRCGRTPLAEAYRQFLPATGWTGFSWAQMADLVERWRGAIAREALLPGERVAVMAKNCIEWVCFDQAALSLGLVVVPLYPTDNAGNIAYILGDCGARMLMVGDHAAWDMLEPLAEQFPQLKRVVCLDDTPAKGMMQPMMQWLTAPPGVSALHRADPGDLATIVYTSGTTGKPKGVMLSHANILSNCDAVLQRVDGYREDVYLSFLPLSHTLERTVGYYVPMVAGSCVAFARSVQDLAEDLLAVRPTMLVSVPRIYERIYAKVQQQLEAKGAPARLLFEKAEQVGWHRFESAQHRAASPSALEQAMWPVLRHLVADNILDKLGGRLRIAVSGGAPISSRIAHCFIGLGLPLLQGYGLTEASPIVTANTPQDNLPESVGQPIPGVEVKLGAEGELLVRGPNVMLGYWNDAKKTADTLQADGWLRTGDVAKIDDEGRVFIVGRLKEILVTSTGEKLPPSDLELAITEDPLFEQAMVVGDNHPFISALAVLNTEEWLRVAAELGVCVDNESLRMHEVESLALRRIAARLAGFPAYARVRRVWLSLDAWTVDNGLITPTLKLRRRELERRFAEPIRRLYEERATV